MNNIYVFAANVFVDLDADLTIGKGFDCHIAQCNAQMIGHFFGQLSYHTTYACEQRKENKEKRKSKIERKKKERKKEKEERKETDARKKVTKCVR